MTKIKNRDLKQLNDSHLTEKLDELRKELMKINAQIAVGTIPQNPGNLKQIKKSIARILTKCGGEVKNKKI